MFGISIKLRLRCLTATVTNETDHTETEEATENGGWLWDNAHLNLRSS